MRHDALRRCGTVENCQNYFSFFVSVPMGCDFMTVQHLCWCRGGTELILIYADIVNIVDGSFISRTKQTGLEVNADKNKYMVRCRDKNAV
jgi:hypothetical protein